MNFEAKRGIMHGKKILDYQRIRKTHHSFGFIPHRFLKDGFLSALKKEEAALYLFYILAADRYGVSFYSDRNICKILHLSLKNLQVLKDELIAKDLIGMQDQVCQVLELPQQPVTDSTGSFANLTRQMQR